MRLHRRIISALFVVGAPVLFCQIAAAETLDPRGPALAAAAQHPDPSGIDAPLSPAFVSSGYRSIHFNTSLSGGFTFPFQVATDADNVFVSDATGNTVKMYQIVAGSVSFVRSFGSAGSGAGQFNGPEQVAVVGNDVYIADFGNNRVQRFNKLTGAYVSQFGVSGSGAGQFSAPSGLIYNPVNGLLYVSEVGNDRVQTFTTAGVYQGQFGSLGSGNGQVNNPYSMAVDGNGNVYVADQMNNRVVKFDRTGAFLRNIGVGVSSPTSVAVDKANLVWVPSGSGDIYAYDALGNYVAYYYGMAPASGWQAGYFLTIRGIAVTQPLPVAPYNGAPAIVVTDGDSQQVQFFSASAQPTSHPTQTSITGLATYNHGIAFDSAENVYIASFNGNTVYKYNKFGTYLTQWGSTGSGNGQFSGAMGIAIDDSDNVYVTDRNNNRVQKFDSTGAYITQWGTAGTGNGQFNHPSGVTTDGSWLYVTEEAGNRVQKFSLSGAYVRQWGSAGTGNGQFNTPVGIAVDRKRNQVYVAEYAGNRIQQFTVFGDFIAVLSSSTSGTGMLSGPLGLTTDQHGNLYCADLNNARVVQFNDNGTYLANFALSGANGIAANPKNGHIYAGTLSSGSVTRFGTTIAKTDTVGVYRPSTQTFRLRNSNANVTPYINATVALAQATDLPITGDWNGDGIDTPGLYRPSTSTFYLWDRWSNLSVATPDYTFAFGTPGDRPIAGDWDGDGKDEVGVFHNADGTNHLRTSLIAGADDYTVTFGTNGDIPVPGDWDTDGASSAGVFRPGITTFYVTNHTLSGAMPVDGTYVFGASGDLPVSGDWTHSGYTGIGVYRPLTDSFYLKNNLDGSPFDSETLFHSGFELATSDLPVAGSWGSAPE